MESRTFLPYLNKFITVHLKDGTAHTGYITNPKDFDDSGRDNFYLHLLIGVSYDKILLSDILDIEIASRTDHNHTISFNISEISKVDEKGD